MPPGGKPPMAAKGGVYTLGFDDFEKKLRQEKPSVFLLVKCPRRPTGRVFSQAVLEKLVALCQEKIQCQNHFG